MGHQYRRTCSDVLKRRSSKCFALTYVPATPTWLRMRAAIGRQKVRRARLASGIGKPGNTTDCFPAKGVSGFANSRRTDLRLLPEQKPVSVSGRYRILLKRPLSTSSSRLTCRVWPGIPNINCLPVGGNKTAVKIIDPVTGERKATVLTMPSTEEDVHNDFGVPNSLEFSSDGKTLISGHMQGRLWLSEATGRNWQNLRSRKLVGHMGILQAVQLSEDGSRLLSCATDGSAILWNTATGRRLLTWHDAQALACTQFSDDLFAFSGWGDDRQIRILPVLRD